MRDRLEVERARQQAREERAAADINARDVKLTRAKRFSRRALLTSAGLAAAILTFVPAILLRGLLYDRSIRTFAVRTRCVTAVAFAPDGHTALSGSLYTDNEPYDHGVYATLSLWDVETGRALRTFLHHQDSVTAVAFAPDGRTALSDNWHDTITLWDVAWGRELRAVKKVGAYGIRSPARQGAVAFAPDRRTVLSDSEEIPSNWGVEWGKTLKLWDVETGKELRAFTGHIKSVEAVAFAPDGRTALSGSRDCTLKLWDVETGKELRTFTGHTASVDAVAFAPDGRTALSGSRDCTLKLWDVETGRELRTFTGHTGSITAVAFAPDGRTALSGSWDRTLKLWDVSR